MPESHTAPALSRLCDIFKMENIIFKKCTANLLSHVCMFMTSARICVLNILSKFSCVTYPFISLSIRFHKDSSFC